MVAPPIGLPPAYHWFPVGELDDSITDPPVQNVVEEPGVIVGVVGVGLTVTTVPVEGDELHPLEETTTV